MCGCVGLITGAKNGFDYAETKMFRDMLYMDAMRGTDATGVMYGTNLNNVHVHKAAMPSWAFMGTKEWGDTDTALTSRGKWAFGHNRAATRGDKGADKNAHPFVVDDKIILMQNGTYRGSHKHHKDVEVDTEACAHVILESESIEKALQSINAAYAFIWYDVEKETINIIRNDERPLYIGYLKKGGIAFASEKYLLMAAAERNSVEFKREPYMIKDGQLCSYNFSEDEFKEEYETVDGKFRQVFPFQASRATGEVVYTGNVKLLPSTTVINQPRSNKHDRIAIFDAINYLQHGLGDSRPEEIVKYLESFYLDPANRDTKYTVEGVDYVKIRELDESDDQYYIFGTICSDDYLNGELVVWTIQGESESRVMHYTSSFFQGHINHLYRKSMNHGTRTCFIMKDIEVVCVLPENSYAQ